MKLESFEKFANGLSHEKQESMFGGYVAEKTYCYTDCTSTSGSSTADCGDGDWD